MWINNKRRFLLEFLVFLMFINYMVITIMLRDNFLLKYMRDIILVYLLIITLLSKNFLKINLIMLSFFGFFFSLLIGFINSNSFDVAFACVRRYLFPIVILYVLTNSYGDRYGEKIHKFIFYFVTVLSLFGIFQAQILGDEFLRKLGYPLQYSYGYGRDMLYNSYYFGGLGIQRVVATLSSSNICGAIFGITLLYSFLCDKVYTNIKYKNFCYLIIGVGYLLTFSRSNFLAMLIIGIFFAWKYIPYKKHIFIILIVSLISFFIFGLIQGTNGIIFKLLLWIQSSLNFTDSSAAGRSSIWITALKQVLISPLGIGLGHVGAFSTNMEQSFSAENSYLTMALDTGWLGFSCYIISFIFIVKKLKKNILISKKYDWKMQRINFSAYVIVIYLLVIMFFSNHIQDMEIISLVYIIVGIAFSSMNKIHYFDKVSVKEEY